MRAVTSALCDAELLPRIWVRGQALFQAGEEPEAVQLVPQAFMNDLVIFLEGDPLEVLRKLSRAAAVFTSSLLFFMVVHLLSLVCLCLFSSVFFLVFSSCVFSLLFFLSLFPSCFQFFFSDEPVRFLCILFVPSLFLFFVFIFPGFKFCVFQNVVELCLLFLSCSSFFTLVFLF